MNEQELFLLKLRIDTLEALQDEQVKVMTEFARGHTQAIIMIRKAFKILGVRIDRLEGKPVSDQSLIDIDFETLTDFLKMEDDE